jgi:hypothetical protein
MMANGWLAGIARRSGPVRSGPILRRARRPGRGRRELRTPQKKKSRRRRLRIEAGYGGVPVRAVLDDRQSKRRRFDDGDLTTAIGRRRYRQRREELKMAKAGSQKRTCRQHILRGRLSSSASSPHRTPGPTRTGGWTGLSPAQRRYIRARQLPVCDT